MNLQGFEARLLEMWMTTRIPLTRPNIQFFTKAPRKRIERWLDELVRDGVLEVDADDDGEMVWAVRGAVRSSGGPTTVQEAEHIDSLRSEVGATSTALTLAARAAGLSRTSPGTRGSGRRAGGLVKSDRKSVIGSGALSFFFGPLGWLYAAPMREAVPAIVIWMLALSLPLIKTVFWMFFPVLAVVSGIIGAAYAWKHNQTGERTPLLDDAKRLLPPRRTP